MRSEEEKNVMSRRSSDLPVPEKHHARLPSLLLPRPDLTNEIETGLDKRLLLIVAPSGYGKSVGLAQAVKRIRIPVLWYVFDEVDSSVLRVATSFCHRLSAMANIEPVPTPATDATPSDCALLINRLVDRGSATGVVLIMDGLDRSPDQQRILPFLQCLLDTGGPKLKLAVTSTTRPDLKLSAVARTGRLARVGTQSLVFSMEETGHLLEMAWGAPVKPQLTAEVHRLTSGWPAGVSLLLLAFPIMPSSHRLLSDVQTAHPWGLLRDKAFERMDERDRELVLSLAFLPFVRPGTAEQLFPSQGLTEKARKLTEGSPAFGVVGGDAYAMSDSIRDELMDIAERILPKGRIDALWKQAAQLMEVHGRLEQALYSYLRTGDIEAANRILAAIGAEQLLEWDAAQLGALANMLNSRDNLGLEANLVCARAYHLRGDFRTCDRYCTAGKKLAEKPQDLLPFAVFQARARSYLSDDDSAEELWDEVKELLSISGSSCGWAYVWLASHLLRSNRIKEAEDELRQALPILRSARDRVYLGWALNRMAHLQLKTGRYRALSATLNEARDMSRESGATQAMVNSYLFAALYWFSGQMEEAAGCISEALHLAEAAGASRWTSLLLLMSGEIALMRGDLDTAGQRLEQAERLSYHVSETRGVDRSLCMSQARYAWAVGAQEEAIGKFEQVLVLPPESQFGSLWDRLDVAVAFLGLGAVERARDLIEEVLSLAEEMESYHAVANGRLLLAYIQHLLDDDKSSRENLELLWSLVRVRGYYFMPASTDSVVEWANRFAESTSSRDQRPQEVLLWGPTTPVAAELELVAPPASPAVKVHTLGGLRLEHQGEVVPDEIWKGIRKAKVLLGLLLSSSSYRVTPDRAMDLLWPTSTAEKARGRLHWAVSSLRKALQAAGVEAHLDIEYRDPYYRLLLSEQVRVDHVIFEMLAEKGLSEARKGNDTPALRYLQEAVEYYGGSYLEDALYQRFAEVRRRQLADLYAEVLHAVASSVEMSSDMSLKWWQKALDHDPYDEEAYRGAAETALAAGLNRKVLQFLDCLKSNLVEELDLPLPEWAKEIESQLDG